MRTLAISTGNLAVIPVAKKSSPEVTFRGENKAKAHMPHPQKVSGFKAFLAACAALFGVATGCDTPNNAEIETIVYEDCVGLCPKEGASSDATQIEVGARMERSPLGPMIPRNASEAREAGAKFAQRILENARGIK